MDGKTTYSNIVELPLNKPNNSLVILGNPVGNSSELQLNEPATLTIYDLIGRRLKSVNASGGLQGVDVSFVPAGTYVVQMIGGDGVVTEREFVKECPLHA